MINSYRTRLKAMIESTPDLRTRKEQLYEAVLKLNEDTLELQIKYHKTSGITTTPTGILKQAQAIMGVDCEEI